MSVELLERASLLDELESALTSAVSGGRVVLVAGEAGIGKTTLVREFANRHEPGVRTVVGLCDPLLTPRALGPWHDIARQLAPGFADQLAACTRREKMFGTFLDELARAGRPLIVVVEDVHWADEATLDLLVFLGRRLDRVPVMTIVTYRDDELAADHPLRTVLGRLPPGRVTLLRPDRLSAAAVAGMARRAGRSAGRLHAVTGGNPLLVTEMLAADTPGVPRKVADLVLSRLVTLAPAAQDVVRFVAVIPGRAELWVVEAALHPPPAVVEECVTAGLLVLSGETVGFRHDLTRQAVAESLSVLRRRALNARALAVLAAARRERGVDLARLAHHAQLTDNAAAVLRWAPAAAEQAAAVGAHREAAGHYRAALEHAAGLPGPARAELLEGLAHHGHLVGLVDEALSARREAVELWTATDQNDRTGENLCRLSRQLMWSGRRTEAEATAVRSIAVLERGEPGRQLAMAYGNMAYLESRVYRWAKSLAWASRAIEAARQADDKETLAHALTSIGSVRLGTGDDRGRADLEQAFEVAAGERMHGQAAQALVFLARIALESRDYRRAEESLERGLSFALAHDLVGYARYLTATRAWWRLDQGDWPGAERDAREALSGPEQPGFGVWFTLVHLGKLQARRGDRAAADTLAEVQRHTADVADPLRIARVAAARAEHAWLRGDLDEVVAAAGDGLCHAVQFGQATPRMVTVRWYAGELAWWVWRAGRRPTAPDWIAEPYRLLLTGEWRRAAAIWAELGCLYEQAEALSCGDDDSALLEALSLYDRLGAAAAAGRLRRRLRDRGTVRVPRGPRPATAGNPGKLTARQLEVLELLGSRLTNADIAAKLSVSVRTVDHHVAAILAKLGVSSRSAAVNAAGRLGIALAEENSRGTPAH